MRRQQAKHAQPSHGRAVPVMACHAVLKSHLQRMPKLATLQPRFPVGKSAKRGPVEVQCSPVL